MEKQYIVHYLNNNASVSQDRYGKLFQIPEGLEEAEISLYADTPDHYRPYCACRIGWNENGLWIYEYALETEIQMTGVGTGCRAWCDSCLEVFLAANVKRPNLYMNYECTPAPYVYLAVGEGSENRTAFRELPEGMNPKSLIIPDVGWSISYCIPISFLKRYFAIETLSAGMEMRANFQKCGDETKVPHWALWNEIMRDDSGILSFHRPQYFGKLLLVLP